jgi:hypothetical protein
MHTIITGTDGPIFLGFALPKYGAWNQLIHYHPLSYYIGHRVIHMMPILFGYPSAFPYMGPYVPFRK